MQDTFYLPVQEHNISRGSLVAKIATYLFVETSHETNTGNWNISATEISETLSIPLEYVYKLKDDVIDEIEMVWKEMVAEINVYQDIDDLWFDITLYHNYISGFVQDDATYEEAE